MLAVSVSQSVTSTCLIRAVKSKCSRPRALGWSSISGKRSNYSDLTRPHPKWWFSKGNTLISGKPRLVKYYNLARKKLHEDGHEDSHSSIGQRVNDKSMGIFGVGSTLQGFGSQEIDLLGLYLEDHPRTCKWLVTPI